MSSENIRRMREAAADVKSRESFTPHEKLISAIQTGAKTQGRPLTADETAAIARHRQNAVDAARRAT